MAGATGSGILGMSASLQEGGASGGRGRGLAGGYGLKQNAALFLLWARATEPSSDELALDAMVDHGKLVRGWLKDVREVVSSVQEEANALIQIGGMGVDVEMDEVCFRARKLQAMAPIATACTLSSSSTPSKR